MLNHVIRANGSQGPLALPQMYSQHEPSMANISHCAAEPLAQPRKALPDTRRLSPAKPRTDLLRSTATPAFTLPTIIDLSAQLQGMPMEALQIRRQLLVDEMAKVDAELNNRRRSVSYSYNTYSSMPSSMYGGGQIESQPPSVLAAELRHCAQQLLDKQRLSSLSPRSPEVATNVIVPAGLPLGPSSAHSSGTMNIMREAAAAPIYTNLPMDSLVRSPRTPDDARAPIFDGVQTYSAHHEAVMMELERLRQQRQAAAAASVSRVERSIPL